MATTDALNGLPWRRPEELLDIGLGRSRVVMVNEAHDRPLRCQRTREVGRRLLPVAHLLGVRHLAMETLWNGDLRHLKDEANDTRRLPADPRGGYLAQPDMRSLVQEALDLGWTLLAYECDFEKQPPELAQRPPGDRERMAWREQEEAQDPAAHVAALPPEARLLVWCGWAHLAKARPRGTLEMMASRFWRRSGIEPFGIDQTVIVAPIPESLPLRDVLPTIRPRLEALGGTAGLLAEEVRAVPGMRHLLARADAFVFSLDNALE